MEKVFPEYSGAAAAIVSTREAAAPHRLISGLLRQMTIHGVGESYARRCLAPLETTQVADALVDLIEDIPWRDHVAAESYRHANGFYKVPLFTAHGARVRVHYWDGTTPAEENVHNHRWRLASRVLVGTLEDETYEFCHPTDPRALELTEFEYGKPAPGRATASRRSVGRAIRLNAKTARMAGAAYSLNPRQLHRIVTHSGTATMTLMVQSAALFPSNTMFTRTEIGDPNIERESLTPSELVAVVIQMIELLRPSHARFNLEGRN